MRLLDEDAGMTPPARFVYKGRRVEIVPPDTRRLIGHYWKIRIDDVERDLLFGSYGAAVDRATELIDLERGAN
jgi:hypothetical protein